MRFTKILSPLLVSLLPLFAGEPAPVRVLVWDEQQPAQNKGYDGGFLGEAIGAHLAKLPGFTVKHANLATPEQGLDAATLDATDVIIWWGHIRQTEVTAEHAQAVDSRVLAGKLSLITLHSAHFSEPFMRLMQERAKQDALKQIPEAERANAKFDFSVPLKRANVKPDSPLTPSLEKYGDTWRLTPPGCIFPYWRADAAPSHVKTLLPDHPIAQGLPAAWDIAHTEMYNEPFHVPVPDAVIFEEKWDKGEHFRSGMLWQVGKGRVFYFRPGHEIYGVYKQAEPLKVLENAARWMTAEQSRARQ